MPPFTDYDSFFDFLTQFFPDLYRRPPNLQLPGLGEWLSPFVTIERLADSRILPHDAAAAEWAARIGWPFPSSDESCDATPHYRLLVAPVDDFTPFQRLLTAPELFVRKFALLLYLVLSKHPANASTILDLLAHEFVLDSGSYDPAPEQGPPDPPPKDDIVPVEWFRALFVRPPAARLSIGPRSGWWHYPEGTAPTSFRAQILLLTRHIARRFIESDQPEEVTVFRHAMDLLKDVMLSGVILPLRRLAAFLLDKTIHIKRDSVDKLEVYGVPTMTGLFAPVSYTPQAILAKWGEPEVHIQHFIDLATNPRELPLLRYIAITNLFPNLSPISENLRPRLLRLVLAILWEAPASTKWDVQVFSGWPTLLGFCFRLVWRNRHVLPPDEYARFLELIRQALAFPLVTYPLGTTPPPDAGLRLYGEHPWPGWYLLREAFRDNVYGTSGRTNLFLRGFPEAFMQSPPWIDDREPPSDTTEVAERLLLDLVRSPADLALLWEARHWAQPPRKWYDFYWARYLLHAQAKFPPTESIPTLVATLRSESTPERHQAVVKLGALAHTGTLSDPTGALAALATAVQDADFWVRLLAIEGLRGFAIASPSPSPLAPPLSVLHALKTIVLHDPEEVIRTAAMETLCVVVATATLPDPPPVVTTLLEITTTQASLIPEFSDEYDPWGEEDPLPRWIRKASNQALLAYLKRLENPTPLLLMLQSDNEDVRAEVVQALGHLGDPRAVPPLVQALHDENPRIQAIVADALGALGDPRAVLPLLQGLQAPGGQVRAAAARALGQLGDSRAIDPLLQALQDPAWRHDQETVIAALHKIGDPQMVTPLIQILRGVNQKRGRWGATRLLGTLGDPAVLPLLHLLQEADPDPHTQFCTIEALGQLGDARAVGPLIQALQTAESRGVREAAVQALGQLGDPRAVGPILQAMKEEENGLMIRDIYNPLGPIANELVVDALVQIGELAVAPLTQSLRDPHRDVREFAQRVLDQICPPGKRKEKDYVSSILDSVADAMEGIQARWTDNSYTLHKTQSKMDKARRNAEKYRRKAEKLRRAYKLTEEELKAFPEESAQILQILADANRLKILQELEAGPDYQKDLSERTDIRGGQWKHHTDALKEAWFIDQETVRGRYVITQLGREALKLAKMLYYRKKTFEKELTSDFEEVGDDQDDFEVPIE